MHAHNKNDNTKPVGVEGIQSLTGFCFQSFSYHRIASSAHYYSASRQMPNFPLTIPLILSCRPVVNPYKAGPLFKINNYLTEPV
jgi:hypothetical protein